uniref:Uncharacterized protein n=1 Tax=Siphoviridae sp. ctVif31 TaxID=2825532 RepID=A0A8S5Q3H7_9CAUD|nr:MAG TPA: hypothetical protein [Siphoviridae sp. ctVif31]
MPKWTEYTSKNTLADNDEVMLYDATGKANKRGLMSKFWDYVVDKMSTAVIGKLETENKTVIGALNYLYGKSIFNGVKQPGTYSFPIKQNSCMLVVLQTSASNNAPVYVVSRYYTDICIQLLTGEREDSKASVKNEQLVITLRYSSCVIIYSF